MSHIDHHFDPDGKGFSLCRHCGRPRIQHDLDVSDRALQTTLELFRARGKPEHESLLRSTEAEIERRKSN